MEPSEAWAHETREAAIQTSLDRACVYGALASIFRAPDGVGFANARARDLPRQCEALERLSADDQLLSIARELRDTFEQADFVRLSRAYDLAFDESSGIRCAPTEMDQLEEIPQLEMTRTFEMADVGGFYRAFGVEIADGGERVDHIAAELEFMNLLAVKEAIALGEEGVTEGPGEHAQICRDASRAFLRDHLTRWAPRLGEGLAVAGGDPIFSLAGRLLGAFIPFDAERIDASRAPIHKLDPANAPHRGAH